MYSRRLELRRPGNGTLPEMTARQRKTFERPRSAVRTSDKTNSARSGERLNAGPCVAAAVQWSKMDEILEETLARQTSGGLANNTAAREPLTKRETQILQSIISGKTNKQIARTLCRSQRTIEYHRHRLMRKLNAHSPADLVRQAIAMGFA
jgi:DNA-binding NarL/FixJ family response regulator